MLEKPPRSSDESKETDKSSSNVTLPPVDATAEEIAQALFRLKPEGEAETPA